MGRHGGLSQGARHVVVAGGLVAVVVVGGVTARAAYGVRDAGGDAAKAVTVPAEGSTIGDPTRGPAPGATGAGGSVPSSGSTTTAKPAPVGLSAPKLTRTLRAGATGQIVRVVQQRLAWTGLSVRDTGVLDGATVGAVRKFEVKQLLSVDGRVDRTTYARLLQVTRRGAALDPRCAGAEHVLCIDKSQKVLRYLVGGKLVMLLDARFGSPELPTREGVFSVYYKSRYQVSTLYHTPMPYAMFFSGGRRSTTPSSLPRSATRGSPTGA